ncbi:dystrophin [Salix suchowensis]|nr:dystrophin [Salix suchowensis]
MLSLKVVLISAGVLSLAVILKLSVLPVVAVFAVSELPVLYSSVLSWLQPPYLYLTINCIIISILASSKLQLQKPAGREQQVPLPSPADMIAPPVQVADQEENVTVRVRSGHDNDAFVVSNDQYGSDYQDLDVEDCTVESSKAAPSMELSFEKEKPSVFARLGRRKSLKSTPEAPAALGVSKPKRDDTLESTWRTITDGRPMPITRHLKKSDTWDTHVRQDDNCPPKLTKKSETFNDRSSSRRPQKLARSPQWSGKLGREPSLNQDELNKRVDAFIKKFNEEMRLQRQKSLNQYQEMIGRGAY